MTTRSRIVVLGLLLLLAGAGAPGRARAGRATGGPRPRGRRRRDDRRRHGPLGRLLLARCSASRRSRTSRCRARTTSGCRACSGSGCASSRMRLGDETIELTEYLTPRGRPIPVDSRSNDRWFQHVAIIVSDMDRAYAWLRQHQVEHASPAPQRLPDWNPNAGGIRAFYFRDPDGHPLEILWFPPGKGDPKWRRPSDRLFLGIDHTAIVVGDTEASLAVLPGHPGASRRRRERELRPGAGAAEQRLRRPPAHHHAAGAVGPGHRVPRVPDAAGRATDPGRYASQRPGPLADDAGQ